MLKLKNLIVFITCWSLFIAPATAVSPTPEPTPSIAKEIKERVQERINSIKQQGKTKAFWGTFKKRTDSTLVLDTAGGEKRVKTDDQTIFVNFSKKEIKISELEIGNFIIALGYWQENESIIAKRVIVLAKEPKPSPERRAVLGKVSEIDKSKKILTIVQLPKKTNINIQVESSTVITKKVDKSVKKVLFAAIEVDDQIIAVGSKKADAGILSAKIIHATPTPTTTTKQKLSPTPTPTTKKPANVSPTPTE